MELFYSQSRRPALKKQVFRNPRHFTGADPKAKKVLIDGHWPEVAKAYADAGVPVIRVDLPSQPVVKPGALPPELADRLQQVQSNLEKSMSAADQVMGS